MGSGQPQSDPSTQDTPIAMTDNVLIKVTREDGKISFHGTIQERVVAEFLDRLPDEQRKTTFVELLREGHKAINRKNAQNYLPGISFAFTGKMRITRDEIEKLVDAIGGNFHQEVSADTDFLVASNINHSANKVKQARSRDVEIISERDWVALLESRTDMSFVELRGTFLDYAADIAEQLLREHADPASSYIKDLMKEHGIGRTYAKTLELFRAGNTPEEIAEKRGQKDQYKVTTILGHLALLIDEGIVKQEEVLPEERIKTIKKAMKKEEIQTPFTNRDFAKLKKSYFPELTYGELKCVAGPDCFED